MKRFFKTSFAMLLALLLVVGLLPVIAQADDYDTLTVYDGTATNSYVPVYGFYADAYLKSQYVIPAADLVDLDGADICVLTYYASQDAVNWGAAEFVVYMGEISEATLDDFVDWDTLTVVRAAGSLGINDGMMEIVLDTPYTYQGGNLVIGITCVTNGTYQSSSWYGTSVTGASVQGYSYSSLDAVTATQRNFIPKTTFSYEVAGTPKEITITADDKTMVWGETEPELTATITGRQAATAPVYTLERDPGDAPGEYEIRVVFDEADNPDYVITAVNGTFLIKKAEVTFTAPEGKDLLFTGEAQELIEAGTAEGGTMVYSLDGVNFAPEIPTATDPGPYEIWYKVIGDENHNNSKVFSVTASIGITLYGEEVNALDNYEVVDGVRLARYDIRIKNLPEAGLAVNSMQIFVEYDPDLATFVCADGAVDWISAEDNGLLGFSWAALEDIEIENEEIVLSLFFDPTEEGYGETMDVVFVVNKLGFGSSVGFVRDGKTVEIEAKTDDGSIEFEEPLWGDANMDGKVSSADAATILRAVVGLSTLSPRAAAYADVDRDGEITAADAAFILSYIIALIDTLPVELA